MTGDTITVNYSCPQCGLVDIEVVLRLRESDEDVIAWMNDVVKPGLGNDHHARSPHCQPAELKEVKIPTPPGTDFIGGPVRQ